MWQVLDTGKQPAKANMELDAQWLKELKSDSHPILHFYDWAEDSATYGYFLRPEKLFNLSEIKRRQVALARRPTGGGVIFHRYDFAFSVLIPSGFKHFSFNTLANYYFINGAVKKALQTFFKNKSSPSSLLTKEGTPIDSDCRHFCMANPTKYDVMIGNQKVAGAAQRRSKEGYLHQGSIALAVPDEGFLEGVLLPHTGVIKAIKRCTFSLLGKESSLKKLEEVRGELKHQLMTHLTKGSM